MGAAGTGGLFAEAGQLAAALEVADERALVLLDEVGYATGTADGLALAWAVVEALLERGALALLATHLLELRRVAHVYPTATHAALEVAVDGGRVACSWRVAPDAAGQAAHYGLALARDMALPDDVLATAARVVALLGDADGGGEARADEGVAARARALRLAHTVVAEMCSCLLCLSPYRVAGGMRARGRAGGRDAADPANAAGPSALRAETTCQW